MVHHAISHPNSHRTGQDRSGQDRTGQDRTEMGARSLSVPCYRRTGYGKTVPPHSDAATNVPVPSRSVSSLFWQRKYVPIPPSWRFDEGSTLSSRPVLTGKSPTLFTGISRQIGWPFLAKGRDFPPNPTGTWVYRLIRGSRKHFVLFPELGPFHSLRLTYVPYEKMDRRPLS